MPSEQPPPHNTSSTRQGPPETLQYPPSRGGVRMLLGLPFSDSGALSTVALTAPLGRHRYGQSPLPASEENDESFREVALDEGFTEEVGNKSTDRHERPISTLHTYETDPQSDFPRAPLRHGDRFSRAMRENAADARSKPTEPSAEHREQTRLVIPGVSTHRTPFPTLFQTTDTPTISVEGEPRDAIPQQAAPLNAPVSLPHAREMTTSDVELLTRLEQLVIEGASAQGMQNGERGGQDLAQRFEHLQRTVRDLAATVSSQAAQMRDNNQTHRHGRTTPAERVVVVPRVNASSSTPRAFWERSRLGRSYLKTGR
jgi:hypothetical protein